MLKCAVRVIAFGGEQGTYPILRRREHEHIALRIELPYGRLNDSFLNHLSRPEVHRSCRGKVAIFRKIGSFVDVESLDRCRNNEIQTGI